MAYMNQERKATIAAALKKVVPAGWKYSLAVRNHSTIVFTLRQAPVDILGNIRGAIEAKSTNDKAAPVVGTYWQVNPYYVESQFSGEIRKTMLGISTALNEGNWDKSDIQSDYFNVGWYVDINIGSWNDPFLDTVPVEQRAKSVKVTASGGSKIPRSELAAFLPSDWASLTPGRKAYATKQAMQLYSAMKG